MKSIIIATAICCLTLTGCANTDSDNSKTAAQELAFKACGVTVEVDSETGEKIIKSVDFETDYSWSSTASVDQLLKVQNRDEERARFAVRAERLDPIWNSLSDYLQEMYEVIWKVWSIREQSPYPKEALVGTTMSNFYAQYGESLLEMDRYNKAENMMWLECTSLFESVID